MRSWRKERRIGRPFLCKVNSLRLVKRLWRQAIQYAAPERASTRWVLRRNDFEKFAKRLSQGRLCAPVSFSGIAINAVLHSAKRTLIKEAPVACVGWGSTRSRGGGEMTTGTTLEVCPNTSESH